MQIKKFLILLFVFFFITLGIILISFRITGIIGNKASNNNLMENQKKLTAYAALDVFIDVKLNDALNFYFDKFGDSENIGVNKDSELSVGDMLDLKNDDLETN